MKRTRRVGNEMLCFCLLVLGSVQAFPGFNNTADLNLTCVNDFIEFADCKFDGQQCSQYTLSIKNEFVDREARCNFTLHGDGRCFCRAPIEQPLWEETMNATVWRGGKRVVSKDIIVKYTIKPRAPTLVSVLPSNVNFQVKWKSNMEVAAVVDDDLEAEITYYKKGDTNKVSKLFKPAVEDQYKIHQILGRDLEPSTIYVVSVKSYQNSSNCSSDQSNEKTFTTPMPYWYWYAIGAILSISAVIFMGAIYCGYYKAKAMWWDGAFKSPNEKLLVMGPSEQKLLKPTLLDISSVCVERPIQDDDKPWSKGLLKDSSDGSSEGSVEVNSGSTLLSYVNTGTVDIRASDQEALGNTFAKISPVLFTGTSPASELHKDSSVFLSPTPLWGCRANNTSSALSDIDNKTYSIIIPSLPQEIPANGPPAHLQAEIECDPAYQASEGHAGIRSEQLLPAPLMLCGSSPSSSLMQTDMSYQQCNAKPESFPQAEAPSVSSFSTVSDDPQSDAEDGPSSDADNLAVQLKAESVMVCDQNPCYGAFQAGSCSFPAVEDEYQPFQSQVGQAGSLCSEEPIGDNLERISAPCFPLPTSVYRPVSTVGQRPFLQVFSADSCPPVTDSSYQIV